MDDWELHFRDKSRRRASRLQFDPNVLRVVLVGAVALLIFLMIALS